MGTRVSINVHASNSAVGARMIVQINSIMIAAATASARGALSSTQDIPIACLVMSRTSARSGFFYMQSAAGTLNHAGSTRAFP